MGVCKRTYRQALQYPRFASIRYAYNPLEFTPNTEYGSINPITVSTGGVYHSPKSFESLCMSRDCRCQSCLGFCISCRIAICWKRTREPFSDIHLCVLVHPCDPHSPRGWFCHLEQNRWLHDRYIYFLSPKLVGHRALHSPQREIFSPVECFPEVWIAHPRPSKPRLHLPEKRDLHVLGNTRSGSVGPEDPDRVVVSETFGGV